MSSVVKQFKETFERRFSQDGRRASPELAAMEWDLSNYNPVEVVEKSKWEIFISHKQGNGGAQCHTLFQYLTHAQGIRVWYDNDAERLNTAGMEEGVQFSRYFVLFVTDGIFERPWCIQELQWAIKYNKHIIVLFESDTRHGGMQVAEFTKQVPDAIRELLMKDEWIKFETRKEFVNACVKMLLERCGIEPAIEATRDIFADASCTCITTPKLLSAHFQQGTRQWLFDAVQDWHTSNQGSMWSQVFTLAGLAGVGKSVFASQVCVRGSTDFPECKQEGHPQVAAFHFFKHDDVKDNQARTALISIASQLRRSVSGFADALTKMAIDPDNLTEKWSLKQVFDNIIAKPAGLLNRVNSTDRLIVVFDALDECAQASTFCQLLQQSWIKDLPNWLGLFVTSRPEYQEGWPTTVSKINTEDHRNTEDIASFLRVKLANDAASPEDLDAMVSVTLELSEGLFLYMRFLDDLLQQARTNKQAKLRRTSTTSSLSLSKRLIRSNKIADNNDGDKLTAADLIDLPQGMGGVLAEFFQRLFDKLDLPERLKELEALDSLKQIEKVQKFELRELQGLEKLGKLDGNLYQNVLAPVADAREPLPMLLWMWCCGLDTYRGTNARKDKKLVTEFDKTRQQCRNLLMESSDPITGTITVRFVHKSMADWLTGSVSDNYDCASKRGCTHLCVSSDLEGHEVLHEKLTKLVVDEKNEGVSVMMDAALQFAEHHRFYHLCKVELFDEAAEIVFNFDSLLGWLQTGGSSVSLVLKDIDEQLIDNQVAKDANPALVRQAEIVRNVLRLGSVAVGEDSRQLAGQIVGRLSVEYMDGEGMKFVKKLHEQARTYKPKPEKDGTVVRWLRPLSPCLETAMQSALIRIIHAPTYTLAVTFSPNGKTLASASFTESPSDDVKGWVYLWNVKTGEAKFGGKALEAHPGFLPSSVAFSPDGKTIVSGSFDKTVRMWNAKTGENKLDGKALQGHTSGVSTVSFSPDGKTLVSGSESKQIRLWDTETGEAKLGGKELQGDSDSVISVAFSPDSKTIITGPHDSTMRFWDIVTGEEVLGGRVLEGHDAHRLSPVAFSLDGKNIASGTYENNICVWNVETGKEILNGKEFEGHTDWLSALSFSPDGKIIVSASNDSSIRLWNVKTCEAMLDGKALEGHSGGVNSISFSPADGNVFASAGNDGTIRIWDANTKEAKSDGSSKALAKHTATVVSVVFSPDCKTIASISKDKTIRLWHSETGQALLGGKALEGHIDRVMSLTFSSDGKIMASGSRDATILLWDVETGAVKLSAKALQGHRAVVTALTFSPDDKTIVSASNDQTVRVWDVETGEAKFGGKPLEGHTSCVICVAFSPDGQTIASGSGDQTIRLWDVATGEAKLGGKALKGHTSNVSSIVFSPNNKTIVSGSWDKTIRLWDVEPDGEVKLDSKVLKGHNEQVKSVALSPDGKTIVSADKVTIRFWNFESSQETRSTGTDAGFHGRGMNLEGRALQSGHESSLVPFNFDQAPRQIMAQYRQSGQWRVCAVLADKKALAFLDTM